MQERKKKVAQGYDALSKKRICELLCVARSSVYYKEKPKNNDDITIMNEIHEIYSRRSYYGYRRIHIVLRERGFVINHKRVQRLFTLSGLQAIYPKKNSSLRNQKHVVFNYLLKNVEIVRPNQAWQVDITYIKVVTGFVYLICLIDIFSRKIMGWTLSIFLDTDSCIQAYTNALLNGSPEIINSDQGSQFTSELWVSTLQNADIKISMDGKGRWADNVYIERLWRTIKYELVFLHSFESVKQARDYIEKYILFYNQERRHQSLNYHTPHEVYNLGFIPSKQELFNSFKKQQPYNTWRLSCNS